MPHWQQDVFSSMVIALLPLGKLIFQILNQSKLIPGNLAQPQSVDGLKCLIVVERRGQFTLLSLFLLHG